MKIPEISIIVPNLNEERFLPKFLGSLRDQSFKDFELIVIDGNSADLSLLILEAWQKVLDLKIMVDVTPNLGFLRNSASHTALGSIMFHTNSDVMMDPYLLENIHNIMLDPNLISMTGRTKPVGSKVIPHFAYQSFDLMRCLFSRLPAPFRKYRPSGNFLVIRSHVFRSLKGFPEIPCNEDGILGQKIDEYVNGNRERKLLFDLKLCVHHHHKRFEEKGSIQTVLFYLYVLGNMFPQLRALFKSIEWKSGEAFKTRSDLKSVAGRKKDGSLHS